MTQPIIKLTDVETYRAANVGIKRQVMSLFRGYEHRASGTESAYGWSNNCDGACAELAVANYFGVEWSESIGNLGYVADVAGYEVRHTPYPNGWLLGGKKDKPERKYILVTGDTPTLQIRGWAYGREFMSDEWWETERRWCPRGPCYRYPQRRLRSITDIDNE